MPISGKGPSSCYLNYTFWICLSLGLLLIFFQPIAEWLGYFGVLDKAEFIFKTNSTSPSVSDPTINTKLDADQKTVINFQFRNPSVTPQNNPAEKNSFPLDDFLNALLGVRNDGLAMSIKNTLAADSNWHNMRVVAWNHHNLQIWIDKVSAFDSQDASIHYTLATILNFSNSAYSNGVLHNFSLGNTIYNLQYRDKVNHLINILSSIFFTLSLVIFLFLARPSLEKADKIEMLCFWVLLGFVSAVVFHYIQGFYYGATYPSNTFLYYRVGEQFKDFYDTMNQTRLLNPYYTLPWAGEYFPFTYIVLFPLSILKRNLALLVYYCLCLTTYFIFLKHYLALPKINRGYKYNNAINLLIIGFLSYPFLFSFERGNIEFMLFLFLATFLFFYGQKKIWLSLPFLILAICLKAYPLVFLVLLVSDKHYFKAFLTLSSAILLSLLSLAIMRHGFHQNLDGFKLSLNSLTSNCTLTPGSCVNFSSSLWGAIKTFFLVFTSDVLTYKKMQIYIATSLISFSAIALYVHLIEKTTWKKIALLTFSMILFPFVSYDYKLMLVFLPLFSFLENEPSPYDFFYLALFIGLLIPKNYYAFSNNIGVSSILNPLFMVLMSAFIIVSGSIKKIESLLKIQN